MTITELLVQFANPELMHSLPLSDKLTAGLVTTILGMGITFTALIILQFVISWMDSILNRSRQTVPQPSTVVPPAESASSTPAAAPSLTDDNELIAAITVALAAQLQTSIDNIVIRNIQKIDTNAPAWHRAGIIDQMNSRI